MDRDFVCSRTRETGGDGLADHLEVSLDSPSERTQIYVSWCLLLVYIYTFSIDTSHYASWRRGHQDYVDSELF